MAWSSLIPEGIVSDDCFGAGLDSICTAELCMLIADEAI
jgi:hypothetical protein